MGNLLEGLKKIWSKPESLEQKEAIDKEQQQTAVKDSTLYGLKMSIDNSEREAPNYRIARRRHFADRAKILAGNSAQRGVTATEKGKNPDVSIKEAADYILDAGGKMNISGNGKISISLDAKKLPKKKGSEKKIGLLDVLPPMKEFSVKIKNENKDGTPGKEVFSQTVQGKIGKDGRMEYFYKNKGGQEVTLRPALLNSGHVSINTEVKFDENLIKNSTPEDLKDIMRDSVETATKQQINQLSAETANEFLKLPRHTVKLPNRKRDGGSYTSFDEETYNEVNTDKLKTANERVLTPDKLEKKIETDEAFVRGVDDLGNPVIVRKTVYEAFKIAKAIARTKGYRLSVNSSYRSYQDQAGIVASHKGKYGSDAERRIWISDPGNSPHHTGGALDLSAINVASGYKDQGALKQIMNEAGFVNYPAENWHWEYGTNRWAKAKGGTAMYDKVMSLKDQKFESPNASPAGTASAVASAPTETRPLVTESVSARPSGAISGKEFLKSLQGLNSVEWEKKVVDEIERGNVPDFVRDKSLWVPITASLGGNSVTYYAMPDYLSIGSNDDYVRVPLTPGAAQIVAEKFGASLPTTKMVDQIWKAATVKLPPQPMGAENTGRKPNVYLRHNEIIQGQLAGKPSGTLVAGHKKDVVMGGLNNVAIYGWHKLNGSPIQPLYTGHEGSYADYSHGVRLIARDVLVNGKKQNLADVLQNSTFAAAISGRGPMTLAQINYPTRFV